MKNTWFLTGVMLFARVVCGAEVPSASAEKDAAGGKCLIGIVSGTHVGAHSSGFQFALVKSAYRLFKRIGVDAVINLGDIANDFREEYYVRYREISRSVFPEGVDEIFVYHGHDMFMRDPKRGRVNLDKDKAFSDVARLLGDRHGQYAKRVFAGTPFLSYPLGVDIARIEREIIAAEKEFPSRPVFVLHHVPCSHTSAGSEHEGDRKLREMLNRHPRAVVLSGHVHGTIAHEGKIWQGEFTAVGFGDFKARMLPKGRFCAAVMELSRVKAVIRRYDVESGEELRPEDPWTLEFPYDPQRPKYSPAVRVNTTPAPVFPSGAEVSAECDVRAGGLTVTFPAVTNPEWAESYAVGIARKSGGASVPFAVQQAGAGEYSLSSENRTKKFKVFFDPAYFKADEEITVSVTPNGFWGNRGNTLSVPCQVRGERVGKWRRAFTADDEAKALVLKGKFLLQEGVITSDRNRRYRVVLEVESSAAEKEGVGFSIWGQGGGSLIRKHLDAGPYPRRRYVFVFNGTPRTYRWLSGAGPLGKVKILEYAIDITEKGE